MRASRDSGIVRVQMPRLGEGYVQALSPGARSRSSSPPRLVSARVSVGSLGAGLARPSAAAPDASGLPRWERLDLLRIELEDGANAGLGDQAGLDGACGYESLCANEDEDEGGEYSDEDADEEDDGGDYRRGAHARGRSRYLDEQALEDRREDDDSENDDDAHDDEDEVASTEGAARRRGTRAPTRRVRPCRVESARDTLPVSNDLMASVFGSAVVSSGDHPQRRPTGKARQSECARDGESDEGESVEGDSYDGLDEARRRTERDLFAVPGVRCVGCLLGPTKLRDVDAFVFESAGTTQPEALWKLAASKYHDCFVATALREGVIAPDWSPESMRIHYEHHHMHERFTRLRICRELRAARDLHLRGFHRRDEHGMPELDQKRTDLLLKIMAAESTHLKELTAISGSVRRGGGAGRGIGSTLRQKPSSGEEGEKPDG